MTEDPQQESKDIDEEMLQAIRNAPEGDLRAFEQLVQAYRKRIVANCRYLTHDENNAEDLAQEVFVKVFFALNSFEGRSTFRHWLQRVKVYHCLNHLKKREGKDSLSIDEDLEPSVEGLRVPPDAHQRLQRMDERKRIGEILNSMPKTLRIPLIMCDMDDLSYEETATSLGIGLSAVKMRLKRGREYFRRLYQGGEEWTRGQVSR